MLEQTGSAGTACHVGRSADEYLGKEDAMPHGAVRPPDKAPGRLAILAGVQRISVRVCAPSGGKAPFAQAKLAADGQCQVRAVQGVEMQLLHPA